MSKDLNLNLVLRAKDGLSGIVHSAVTKSDKDFQNLQQSIKGVGDKLQDIGQKSAITGTALLGVTALNIKTAGDFESSMANVSTLIDTNVESIQGMGKEVLGIGRRTPVALNDLTSSLYDIRSAGVDAANQFKVLEKSAQLGVAGMGSTSQAVDLVTSSMNAFGLKGAAADKIYDNIFKTTKYGKTTIAGIAQGFGSVAGTVAAANIKLDDYLSAVAALTTTGQPATVAHTQIKAAISGMTRETKESRKVFKALGAENFKDLIQKSGGMVNAFSRISKQVKGNDAAILQLFGSTEAYNAVVGLTTKQHQLYIETLNSMRNGPSLVDEGYAKKLNTINAQLQRGQNMMQKISIDFGTSIAPAFNQVLGVGEKVLNVIDALPDSVKTFMASATALGGVGLIAFGGLMMGAGLVTKGFAGVLGAYREIDIYMWAHPLKMPKLEFGTFKGNIANIKNAYRNACIGIVTNFQMLGAKIANTFAIMSTSFLVAPNKALWALGGLKKGIGALVGPLVSATKAQWAFTGALLTSPITWVVAGIAGAAVLIFKYWKPITAFFRGLWSGIVEGTKPLHPVFNKIGQAVKPIVGVFQRLVAPINTAGKASENLGLKIGKAIGGAIVWLANFGKTVLNIVKWTQPLYWLFKGGKWVAQVTHKNSEDAKKGVAGKNKKVDDSLAKGLSYVPRDGYVAELHKGERVLTSQENKNYNSDSKNITVQYSPVFQLMGEMQEAPQWLKTLLKQHMQEILRLLNEAQRRKEARSYALS